METKTTETNGYVREKTCIARHEGTSKDIEDIKGSIKEVRKDIKELNDKTYKIMMVIGIILTLMNVGGDFLIKMLMG